MVATLTKDQLAVAETVAESPRYFVREALGCRTYDKQDAILDAIATSRRVSVAGANGTGKDWTTGRAILWWLASRYPAKVIVTGPTNRQVYDIIWREVRHAHLNARYPVGGTLSQGLYSARLDFDDQHFATGFATDNPYSLQGYHSPNLMVIITEAHAMPAEDIDALRTLQPDRLVMTGNPLVSEGPFFDSHHSLRHLYACIQISAFDTPNLQDPDAPEAGLPEYPGMITKLAAQDRLDEWGEESPMYVGGILGQFPQGLDENIISLVSATEAKNRQSEPEGPIILSCDVARLGKDKTIVIRRQGDVARIVKKIQGRDTVEVASFLGTYIEQENRKHGQDISLCVVDEVGVGAGVIDNLRRMRLGATRLKGFIGGASALDSKHYNNAITEAYMTMRKWFLGQRPFEGSQPDIENDGFLIGQITSRKFSFVGQDKVEIESKKKMRKSPDEADALAMTFVPRSAIMPEDTKVISVSKRSRWRS